MLLQVIHAMPIVDYTTLDSMMQHSKMKVLLMMKLAIIGIAMLRSLVL